ncbi:hypothetical protein [Thermomonospora catenispora]|uniref:hypothetical protein n=1 Tax=Thermomonospora catenispora TaxID=2493090 RepID=UPI0011201D5D|nr:hypothetical protein [Thermomonospora catenispora]TNY36568.1 hypothetical protein EIO00_12285 [Thermomonospora catenispora]
MPDVVLRDETAAGRPAGALRLSDLPERMTLRELIRLRVREEVARCDADPSRDPAGPAGARRTGRAGPAVDWVERADRAERAFAANGFFVFSADRRLEDLDEEPDLTAGLELTFVKVVPPAGG